jgi:hypothetical protein
VQQASKRGAMITAGLLRDAHGDMAIAIAIAIAIAAGCESAIGSERAGGGGR